MLENCHKQVFIQPPWLLSLSFLAILSIVAGAQRKKYDPPPHKIGSTVSMALGLQLGREK